MMRHRERHRAERIGWLPAAVLGANAALLCLAALGALAARAGGACPWIGSVRVLFWSAAAMAATTAVGALFGTRVA
jgi:vacuolar iron transporter family protein